MKCHCSPRKLFPRKLSLASARGSALIALKAYFDGSYTGRAWTEGGFLTLAGFAAEESIWTDFDCEWQRILTDDRSRPRASYLHMREAAHLKGEFSIRNGWNLRKVESLIVDLLRYFQTLDKQRFRQFACTVDLSAHERLAAEGLKLEDPISRCNRSCPEIVLAWYATKYPGIVHSLHYYFDQEEPFEERFREKCDEEKNKKLGVSASEMFWSLIRTVANADMRVTPPLQAADLLAWASNRSASKKVGEASFTQVEPFMKNLIPSTWSFWGEPELRQGRMIKP